MLWQSPIAACFKFFSVSLFTLTTCKSVCSLVRIMHGAWNKYIFMIIIHIFVYFSLKHFESVFAVAEYNVVLWGTISRCSKKPVLYLKSVKILVYEWNGILFNLMEWSGFLFKALWITMNQPQPDRLSYFYITSLFSKSEWFVWGSKFSAFPLL